MKKVLSLSLTLALLCAFTACGKNDSGKTDDSDKIPVVTEAPTEAPTEPAEEIAEPTQALDDTISDDNKPAVSGESPAKILYADFQSIIADGEQHTCADIAEKLSQNEIFPFMLATMETSEGWINGFDEEINGFKSAAFFGPMIGTIPFVGYVFELDANADVDAFTALLNEKSNLAWNVCTQADEKVCESEGNFVFFVMSPAQFED